MQSGPVSQVPQGHLVRLRDARRAGARLRAPRGALFLLTDVVRGPVPQCPIRPGEPCTLCQVSVTGPQDCGLVYLVMSDPDLRHQLARPRR